MADTKKHDLIIFYLQSYNSKRRRSMRIVLRHLTLAASAGLFLLLTACAGVGTSNAQGTLTAHIGSVRVLPPEFPVHKAY